MSSEKMKELIANIERNFDYQFHPEQKQAFESLMAGQNTVVTLPTGYGKSEIYAFAPLLKDQVDKGTHHMCLVISPLKSLMRDQVERWNKAGVKSAAVLTRKEMDDDSVREIEEGHHSLLFVSPEAALMDFWWSVWSRLSKRIAFIAFDEAHCITEWGDSFRPDYADIGRLRCLLSKATTVILTATLTVPMMDDILKKLFLETQSTSFISKVSDRSNIFLGIERDDVSYASLDWYVDILREQGMTAPKTLIFCRSMEHVKGVFKHIHQHLEYDQAWVKPGGDPGSLIIEMFHASLDTNTAEMLQNEFTSRDSSVRCLVSTVAFGMGVQIPDIQYVLHWGPPNSLLTYWQEVGRCARDKTLSGRAIMYVPPRSVVSTRTSKDMISLVKDSKCIREQVLTALQVKGISVEDIKAVCGGSKCCVRCSSARKENVC